MRHHALPAIGREHHREAVEAPALAAVGMGEVDQGRFLRTFNAWAEPFRSASTVRLPDPHRRPL